MRILVVSDSHGMQGRLGTILMAAEADGGLDAVIHLGDGYDDLRDYQAHLPPVYQVAGNCDLFRNDTLEVVSLSNARILLTHGHFQHVREGEDDLLSLAITERAQAALYGHTHVQKAEWRSGVLLLNPGAAQNGRYAILTVNRLGAVDFSLHGD